MIKKRDNKLMKMFKTQRGGVMVLHGLSLGKYFDAARKALDRLITSEEKKNG